MQTRMLRSSWAEWVELKGASELTQSWKSRVTKLNDEGRKKTADLQARLRESYGNTPNYGNNVVKGSIKTDIVYRDLEAQ